MVLINSVLSNLYSQNDIPKPNSDFEEDSLATGRKKDKYRGWKTF